MSKEGEFVGVRLKNTAKLVVDSMTKRLIDKRNHGLDIIDALKQKGRKVPIKQYSIVDLPHSFLSHINRSEVRSDEGAVLFSIESRGGLIFPNIKVHDHSSGFTWITQGGGPKSIVCDVCTLTLSRKHDVLEIDPLDLVLLEGCNLVVNQEGMLIAAVNYGVTIYEPCDENLLVGPLLALLSYRYEVSRNSHDCL